MKKGYVPKLLCRKDCNYHLMLHSLKSTVCAKIMEQLGQDAVESRRVVIISQESFYKELSEEEAEEAKVGNFNFDHPGDLTYHCSTIRSPQFPLCLSE